MTGEWRQPQQDDRAMVILTCVDGALRETSAGSCAALRASVAELASRRVPVVLTSHHSRTELGALVEELGLAEPFIAENGRVLCVPKGYFARLPELSASDSRWDAIEFEPASIEDAIEMLMWLYRVSGDSPLLVGVGASWTDHLLLRHVDVPVVVKNPGVDQRRLHAQFPHAYVTFASGPDGWNEAVLGIRPDGDRSAAAS